MTIDFKGYNENVTTFIADNTVTDGCLVKVSDDGTVSKSGTNEVFCGVCVGVRGGCAAVQLNGYIEVPAASKINAGYRKLVSNSAGKVTTNDGGRELLVVNSTNTTVGFIL